MQKIGVLVKSETPDDDEANDALDSLNALIDSWSNDYACITSRVSETFTLSSSASYTIGIGEDFNTARPMQIVDAYTSLAQVDYPVEIVNQEIYNSISFKNIQGRPYILTYNSGFPVGQITVYPIPDDSYTLTILSEKALTGFATLDTELTLPTGWERALVYNLALELAPEYGQQPDQSIAAIASESLGAVKIAAIRARPITSEVDAREIGNIYNGWL